MPALLVKQRSIQRFHGNVHEFGLGQNKRKRKDLWELHIIYKFYFLGRKVYEGFN